MPDTGIETQYAVVDGKRLRCGWTTGTCAAAAAKAAAILLLTGRAPERVCIDTPKGIPLELPVEEPLLSDGRASCAVRKFSGDDPDVTDGARVRADVSAGAPGVRIDGGAGVGRVTKPGLRVPVGEAAINPAPREMIRAAVSGVLEETGAADGLDVVISVPGGEELAKKTFNPRLGIEGGISILGTSGIVEPMSEEALTESIRLEIRQRRALGDRRLILTPGNYGADFLREACGIPEERIVKCSNFIGKALGFAAEEGFSEALLAGHVGKLVKLSGGITQTHSREGDCRAELMAACALRAGADGDAARAVLGCVTTDAMLAVLKERGLLEGAMKALGERIGYYLDARTAGSLTAAALVFADGYGTLCTAGPAEEWLREERGARDPRGGSEGKA